MLRFMKCIFGPRLFRIHRCEEHNARDYTPNALENLGDRVIKWMKFCWSVSYWTSPVLLVILYRRDTFTWPGLASATSYAFCISIVLCVSFIVRAIGRRSNPTYMKFLGDLERAHKNYSPDTKRKLAYYDCEFSAWPVDFKWSSTSNKKHNKSRRIDNSQKSEGQVDAPGLPYQLLSYAAAHSFGCRMVYPGATALIKTLMGPMLQQGRAKLIEEKSGQRNKLQTEGGNTVDTLFVDRRNQPNLTNGNVLVICCEGNSGFYEVGSTVTPLEAGYSVLGWNHPGFWGSSGKPFPREEQQAIDTVMQYAINKLGFSPDDIILFAWSIGGYTASWAAMNYPDIRHVVLDATFDDLLPLAIARMPKSWRSLVAVTIKKYLNLNNAEQLCRYPGPILLIRRAKDEMITTVDPTMISSNRGNDLLIKLLQYRYPGIVNDVSMPFLREWLATDKTGQVALWLKHDISTDLCSTTLQSYILEHSADFPLMIGDGLDRQLKIKLALYLASRYMEDFDSTHCTPLPASHFKTPWSLTV